MPLDARTIDVSTDPRFIVPALDLETLPRPDDFAGEIDSAFVFRWARNSRLAYCADGQWRAFYAAHPGRVTGWTNQTSATNLQRAGVVEKVHFRTSYRPVVGAEEIRPLENPTAEELALVPSREELPNMEQQRQRVIAEDMARLVASIKAEEAASDKEAARAKEDLRKQYEAEKEQIAQARAAADAAFKAKAAENQQLIEQDRRNRKKRLDDQKKILEANQQAASLLAAQQLAQQPRLPPPQQPDASEQGPLSMDTREAPEDNEKE